MSEFLGKRYVTINLPRTGEPLPPELEPFDLIPVDGSSDLFEMPYYSLNSLEWSEFERVMFALKVRGKSRGWRVAGVA